MNHQPSVTPLPRACQVAWHAARRDWTNLSFRRHRQFDGFIVSMHQSGTHWLKYLITLVLARRFGLPVPDSIGDSHVIGGPRERPRYEVSPRLGSSHTIPSPLLDCLLYLHRDCLPRYLVLVRDVRDVLLAHYRKWQDRYSCPFSEYLRGDCSGRRFEKDIWWDIRFLNRWGALAAAHPSTLRVLRYEDLRSDTRVSLQQALQFLGVEIAIDDPLLAQAVTDASKDKMAEKDPHPFGFAVVRDEERPWDDWYGEDDRRWLRAACARFLRHDFGYGYADWI